VHRSASRASGRHRALDGRVELPARRSTRRHASLTQGARRSLRSRRGRRPRRSRRAGAVNRMTIARAVTLRLDRVRVRPGDRRAARSTGTTVATDRRNVRRRSRPAGRSRPARRHRDKNAPRTAARRATTTTSSSHARRRADRPLLRPLAPDPHDDTDPRVLRGRDVGTAAVLPRLAVQGAARRVRRPHDAVAIKASRNDLDTAEDANLTDTISLSVSVTPRYTVVPRA
jgi:hypothetical protein